VKHFQHCYAYEGSYCSCGAVETGGYQGDQPGPDMDLPPAPFNLTAPQTAATVAGPCTVAWHAHPDGQYGDTCRYDQPA
jgi:hypothetical protein